MIVIVLIRQHCKKLVTGHYLIIRALDAGWVIISGGVVLIMK